MGRFNYAKNSIGPLWEGAVLNNPFTIFKHTVNVLVVEDEPEFWTSVKGLLELFDIYSVHIAESTGEALEIIKNSGKRFHACVLDRGMNDVDRNEFHLIDKFGKTIPFIIMSARDDNEKTFECARRGAKAYIRKGVPEFDYKLVSNINKFAMQNILCPKYNEGQPDLFCKCLDTLILSKPLSVGEWARSMNVDERQVHRECKGQLGVNPLHIIYTFHLYSDLFKYIENYLMQSPPTALFSLKNCGEYLLKSSDHKRFFEYYLINRSKIHPYIMAPVSN
jgi:CheY-like chemotaxis protein